MAVTVIGLPVALTGAGIFGCVASIAPIGPRSLKRAGPGGDGIVGAMVAGPVRVARTGWVPAVGVWLAVICARRGAVPLTRFRTDGWNRPS